MSVELLWILAILGILLIVHILMWIDESGQKQVRGYYLSSDGIVMFEIVENTFHQINKCSCSCNNCGSGRTPSVEDYCVHRHGAHIENFEAPDYMPEEQIETISLLDKVYDNIVGRIPGLDGKGIKKLKVRAKFDGKVYIVRDFDNFQEAAETLAKINADARKLIKYMKETYPDSEYTIELAKNYDGNLSEETPKNLENLTSYTLDKREIISCLRTKDSKNKIHDYNLLLYVFIHEMSHMANARSYGHNADFENAFEFLLKRADELGILKRIDFESNPQNFCGLPITTNLDY
jgi:hypothetical protein